MNKTDLDEMYHNLRRLCVTSDLVQKEAVLGITTHLTTAGGEYTGLLRFLSYYGEEYILPPVLEILQRTNLHAERIVEFGAGFGWLGRGISNANDNLPVVFIDKRQYVFTDIVADLESVQGRDRVLEQMKDNDIIVMSEFLHCLDNPKKVLRPFVKWPMVVVEYNPNNSSFKASYDEQIKKFNCIPIPSFREIFPSSKLTSYLADPYTILIIEPM